MNTQWSVLLGVALCAAVVTSASAADPVLGKSPRYCNPLPMVSGGGASASGDVTVIRDNGKYYMYCTGGGAWVSDDLLNWTLHRVANVPVAPDLVKYNGAFYMCGNSENNGTLFKADNPLGPFTRVGDWKNTPDVAGGWNSAFDMDIFVDDDNKPYLYYPGRGVSGIYVVPLDPNDLTRFAGPPIHLFGFNSAHVWERYGEMNEYPDVAWIEGPWLQKHNGTYYLEYSASGTQWKTYAEGYYTAKSPTGPFTYAPNNPLLRRTQGLVTGTGHGSIVEGPDGNLWQFYTIVLDNPPGGRRIGMDPIAFDKDGNMSCRITDTPQWAPGVVADPAKNGDSGSIPVSINKVRAMNALSRFSSEQSGHYAAYAVDNSSGTWWEPAPDDAQPTLTLDLGPATRFDVTQLFKIDSVRLMFTGGGRGFGGRGFGGRGFGRRGGPGAEPAATGTNTTSAMASAPSLPPTDAYQYKIEVSTDGNSYTTVLDQSTNTIIRNTIFEEIPPTQCRFVRLTMINWPRATPLGIIEFTVFGNAAGSLPAQVPIPEEH
ncbi:MAG TPA: family 43 glycosylhydrolase [Verrucomicrobiae bacterium]|nr:family 43 glycosylhydrolase [Verrucomicrobiae bacterium]